MSFNKPVTFVLHGRALAEELERGVAAHFEALGELAVFGGVHFGQLDWALLLLQLSGSLGVLGRQCFAVAAPGGVWLIFTSINSFNIGKPTK